MKISLILHEQRAYKFIADFLLFQKYKSIFVYTDFPYIDSIRFSPDFKSRPLSLINIFRRFKKLKRKRSFIESSQSKRLNTWDPFPSFLPFEYIVRQKHRGWRNERIAIHLGFIPSRDNFGTRSKRNTGIIV